MQLWGEVYGVSIESVYNALESVGMRCKTLEEGMKNILIAILFFLCAFVDGYWTFSIWTGAILYGADAGAVITLTLFSSIGGIICLIGGIYYLLELWR